MAKISKKIECLVMLPLCALFFFIGAVMAQAATYYVATAGNDANPGTASQAFRTIARGINSLKAGDTLYIRGGTYAESIDSNKQTIPTGTSWADAPVISAYPNESVVLQIGGTSGDIINLPHSYIQYVVFQQLILNGGSQGVSIGAAHHVKFVNLEIKNSYRNGVHINAAGGHDIWFTGGSVHDVGASLTNYPFYIEADDNLIEHMTLYDVPRYCIHNFSASRTTHRNVYRNNVLHHCGLSFSSDAALLLTSGDDNKAYNNVLYTNSAHGIQVGAGSTNAKVYNNTVYGGSQLGIQILSGATNAVVKNNLVVGNTTGQIRDLGTGTTSDHNITTNPSFVNAATFDFNLLASSPAIDAGEFLSQVTTDFRKVPRPQGRTHDIGAYEGAGSSDIAPPLRPEGLAIQ